MVPNSTDVMVNSHLCLLSVQGRRGFCTMKDLSIDTSWRETRIDCHTISCQPSGPHASTTSCCNNSIGQNPVLNGSDQHLKAVSVSTFTGSLSRRFDFCSFCGHICCYFNLLTLISKTMNHKPYSNTTDTAMS